MTLPRPALAVLLAVILGLAAVPSAAQEGGDFADGLAGGPDFLAVATRDGGALNLRAEASSSAAVVGRLAQGTVLRALGCRMAEGRRWCRVATLADPGVEGWAAGEFLVEAADPALPTAPAADPGETCRAAVVAMAGRPDVVVIGQVPGESGGLVSLAVGPDRAPWQCIARPDGSTEGVMFLGDDSAGVVPQAAPSPAEQACLAAVAAETANPEVVLLGSDSSGADTLVQVGVGPQLAPWQCFAGADGTTRGIEFLGQDGGDVAVAPFDDNPAASAEAACIAAVAAAAASASVTPLAVIPVGETTVARLVVGTADAPWTCSVGPDGTAFDVRALDGG